MASAAIPEVVVGATRKEIRVTIIDEYNLPIDISGGSVKLQGTSLDVAKEIDIAGAIHDGPNGVAKWTSAGTILVIGDLESKPEATFKLRVQFTDAATKIDYGPEFSIQWVEAPV